MEVAKLKSEIETNHQVKHEGIFGGKRNGLIVIVMILGVFVAIMNETLLNVALTPIMNDLGITANTAQWLSTGYLLVIGVLIPATAFLIKRFTTRDLFLSAMVVFTTGTLVAAIAPSFVVLFVGRLIQAAGTGLLFPLLTNVVLALVPHHKRGTAMGTIGIVITFAPAIGPTLSGFIVTHYNWRVLFYSILPIAIAIIIFAYFSLKNITESRNHKFDLLSILLSTLGFGGVVYGFSSAGEGHGGWTEPMTIFSIVTGCIALGIFCWRQLTMKEPMLDLRAFQYRIYRISVIISAIVNMALFASMMLVPIFLQNAFGYTSLKAGLVMLPGGIIMGIMSPVTGRLFDKFGAKWLVLIGLTLMASTLLGFAFMTVSTAYSMVTTLNALFMLGISMLMMPVMTNGLNELPKSLYPHGTAISGTLQQVGGAIGMALLVTVMTTSSNNFLVKNTGTMTILNLEVFAMTEGMKHAFLLAFALVIIALFLAVMFLKRSIPPVSEIENERFLSH
ncbi:MDR family MFS transporter [Paenibacillus luteus]|uniref:MDR family MFS transporter n=1 Tax=Paenibacillus luteus TaxID=2545753 RepID=UPI0011438F4E|nr:MDR family MFS transporter [Paenibacillus luteus]